MPTALLFWSFHSHGLCQIPDDLGVWGLLDWGCSPEASHFTPVSGYVFIHIPHHERGRAAQALQQNDLPDHEELWSTFVTSGHISSGQHTHHKGSTAPPQFLNSLILPSLSYFPKVWIWISNRCQRRKLKKDRYSYCCLGFGILRIHQTKRVCL